MLGDMKMSNSHSALKVLRLVEVTAICTERWLSGKESACQFRRHRRCRFDTWVGKISWRKWQPTPVFLPGKFHGQKSLAGYSPWGCKESDTTEHIHSNVTLWFVVYCCSVAQLCPTLCNPMDIRLTFLHYLWELAQTHVHWVDDAIVPYHPLLPPSPPALNLSQHQALFQWVSSSNQVAKVSELQLQHQSFQWTPRTDLLQDGLVGSPCCPRGLSRVLCSDQIRSVAQLCPTLCDPMNRSTPGLPVHHQLPEFTRSMQRGDACKQTWEIIFHGRNGTHVELDRYLELVRHRFEAEGMAWAKARKSEMTCCVLERSN